MIAGEDADFNGIFFYLSLHHIADISCINHPILNVSFILQRPRVYKLSLTILSVISI